MIAQGTDRVILRRESFGGIVFNPLNGVHLELDSDGFELAVSYFVGNSSVDRGYSLSFLKTLLRRLGPLPAQPARLVQNRMFKEGDFRLLSGPTLADIQITSVCTQGCPHCYASAVSKGEHMPFADVSRILDQCADVGVLQVALGGGDPLLHPDFEKIVRAVRERGMVPNVTTSGAYFSDSNLLALRDYCGAVALSLEGVGKRYTARRALGWERFCAALDRMREYDIPTVLQVTLGASNLDDLPKIVDFSLSRPLYGVIFLAYKPVGRGDGFDKPLSALAGNVVAEKFSHAFRILSGHTRVGYDCCLSAIVTGMNENVFGHGNEDIEGCSALRGSVGISVNQKLLPCTFLEQHVCADLRLTTISSAWGGDKAFHFRRTHERSIENDSHCSQCEYSRKCMGGCPVLNLGRCPSYTVRPVSLGDSLHRANMANA